MRLKESGAKSGAMTGARPPVRAGARPGGKPFVKRAAPAAARPASGAGDGPKAGPKAGAKGSPNTRARFNSSATAAPRHAGKPSDGQAPRSAPRSDPRPAPRPEPRWEAKRKPVTPAPAPQTHGPSERVRVSKLMAEMGMTKRREADDFIERGWVLVDGKPVPELGTRIFPHQKITLTSEALAEQKERAARELNRPRPDLDAANAGKIRLSKLMSQQGLCSRREADSYITRGWVLVDDKPVTELGSRIFPHQKITLKRAAQNQQEARVTIILNKPIGYVSAQAERDYVPAVTLITAPARWAADTSPIRFSNEHLVGLAPAGRLDIDSQGLLIMTQDGRIAKQLIGADSETDKEYLVRVEGRLSPADLALLNHGISLDDEPLKPAIVEWQNRDQLRFVLREGKKRQIRRMCELVGLKVVGLKRIRIGNIVLGELPVGEWRYLGPGETF